MGRPFHSYLLYEAFRKIPQGNLNLSSSLLKWNQFAFVNNRDWRRRRTRPMMRVRYKVDPAFGHTTAGYHRWCGLIGRHAFKPHHFSFVRPRKLKDL